MLKILANEITRLRREESGVALMMTLSIVLLLYILCAGVYSIGETVRQKIEIQNAADAAAYSAAVVEADGLNRMALINRAMSWTYIQLTNMQIDYITYKWLELVEKRFTEDWNMCRNHNAGTSFPDGDIPIIWPLRDKQCRANPKLFEPGIGWFCGIAGKGMDMVYLNRMNQDDDPVPIQEIRNILRNPDVARAIEEYETLIPAFKNKISFYNAMLHNVNSAMRDSMSNTAALTLYYNLPRDPETGDVDRGVSKDFLAFIDYPCGVDPYQKIQFDDGTEGANIFSPLYNTELDERMFLAMADGEAHDRLVDCFGRTVDDKLRCVGLDQWFVRSYANEIFKSDAKFDMELPNDKYEPTNDNSLKSPGICRVYKHANRTHFGGDLPVYRANHRGVEDDDLPSCVNTHALCPEQCKSSPDSIALYADYEWSSGRYTLTCTHVHAKPRKKEYHVTHYHRYEADFIESCTCRNHRSPGLGSHTREAYGNCWAKGNHLRIPVIDWRWPGFMPLECNGDILLIGQYLQYLNPLASLLGIPNVSNDGNHHNFPPGWSLTQGLAKWANFYHPNGFSRIYGDDKELLNNPVSREAYSGEPAMPWILNDSYYTGGGTVTVGLARKQRNPWTFLLNAMQDILSKDRRSEEGIYSAFDPVPNGYIVAFSAARAGHLFHPSPSQSAYGVVEASPGEYEARYDAVCDDYDPAEKRFNDGPNAGRRFKVDDSNHALCKLRVGCVCNDHENSARLARCWNLCETDWDATLLPLRYSHAPLSGEWWDSYANTLGGDRHIGGVIWDDEIANLKDPPFVDAAGRKWASLPDGAVETGGGFLLMRKPMTVLGRGSESVEAPYFEVEIEKALKVNGRETVLPGELIRQRIL